MLSRQPNFPSMDTENTWSIYTMEYYETYKGNSNTQYNMNITL